MFNIKCKMVGVDDKLMTPSLLTCLHLLGDVL